MDTAGYLGTIPVAYDQYLVPLLFRPFALDLAARAAALAPEALLEIACGTGALTRELRKALPAGTRLVATDISETMLEAARRGPDHDGGITWQQADACALPFPDESFDLVVCQFGLMFFPDRLAGLSQVKRVLRRGGRALMNVWGSPEANPIGELSHQNILEFFPENPPGFYRMPYSLSDQSEVGELFRTAGFSEISLDTVAREGVCRSARDAATGMVIGTPALSALQQLGVTEYTPIIERLARRLESIGGRAPLTIPMQAIVISATKEIL